MRLAACARAAGLPTAYYILPQEWLWGLPGGTAKVAKACDKLIAVFRREAEAYAAAGGNVAFVGHPLVDLLGGIERPTPAAGRVVALLPGSRAQEVRTLLPAFLGAAALLADRFPDARFLLPVPAEGLAAEIDGAVARSGLAVERVPGGAAAWAGADVVLAASGTAVLEAAILDVPCVAAYRVSWLTAFLAQRLLRVRHVTLPNIVAGRAIVPELLQGDARAERLADAVGRLLADPTAARAMRAGYAEVRVLLGGPGAIARAAAEVLATATPRTPASTLPPTPTSEPGMR
jgi:lipid-A-disaccharide synthase